MAGIDFRTMAGAADDDFWEAVLDLAADQMSQLIREGLTPVQDPTQAMWLPVSGHAASAQRRPRSQTQIQNHGGRRVGAYDADGSRIG